MNVKNEWIVIERGTAGRGAVSLPPDDGVRVSLYKGKAGRKTLQIAFGAKLTKRLRWIAGDKLTVMVSPDGKAYRFERGKEAGYTLSTKSSKSGVMRIQITTSQIPVECAVGSVTSDAIETDATGCTIIIQ